LLRKEYGDGDTGALRALIDFLLSPRAEAGGSAHVRELLAIAGQAGGALSPDEISLAATRALLVFAEAVAVYENEADAWEWWTRPIRLGDETAPIPPSVRVHDAAGAADLASRIRRTAHGIY